MRIATPALCLTICVSAGAIGVAARSTPRQLPATFTNLQLLPKDVTPAQLVDVMKVFTRDLGVRCEHCHIGEGNDLSKFDFASDARPTKKTARVMMKLVATINQDLLKGVGSASTDPPVGCYTCHRGTLKPPAKAPAAGRGGGRLDRRR